MPQPSQGWPLWLPCGVLQGWGVQISHPGRTQVSLPVQPLTASFCLEGFAHIPIVQPLLIFQDQGPMSRPARSLGDQVTTFEDTALPESAASPGLVHNGALAGRTAVVPAFAPFHLDSSWENTINLGRQSTQPQRRPHLGPLTSEVPSDDVGDDPSRPYPLCPRGCGSSDTRRKGLSSGI